MSISTEWTNTHKTGAAHRIAAAIDVALAGGLPRGHHAAQAREAAFVVGVGLRRGGDESRASQGGEKCKVEVEEHV